MKLETIGRLACQSAAQQLDELQHLGPGGRRCHFSPCCFPGCGCLKSCAIHLHYQIECSDCQEANTKDSLRPGTCAGKCGGTLEPHKDLVIAEGAFSDSGVAAASVDTDIRIPLRSTAEAIRLICEEGYVFSSGVSPTDHASPASSQGIQTRPAMPLLLAERAAQCGPKYSCSLDSESGLLEPGKPLSSEEFDSAFARIKNSYRSTIYQAGQVEHAIFDLTETVIRAEHNAGIYRPSGIYRHDVDPLRRGSLPDCNIPAGPDCPEESTDVLATSVHIECMDRWC